MLFLLPFSFSFFQYLLLLLLLLLLFWCVLLSCKTVYMCYLVLCTQKEEEEIKKITQKDQVNTFTDWNRFLNESIQIDILFYDFIITSICYAVACCSLLCAYMDMVLQIQINLWPHSEINEPVSPVRFSMILNMAMELFFSPFRALSYWIVNESLSLSLSFNYGYRQQSVVRTNGFSFSWFIHLKRVCFNFNWKWK